MPPKKVNASKKNSSRDDDEELLRQFEKARKQDDNNTAAAASANSSKSSKAAATQSAVAEKKLTFAERKKQQEQEAAAATQKQIAENLERQRMMQQFQMMQMMQMMQSPFLKSPKRDVTKEEFAPAASGLIKQSVAAEAQGWRRAMEDAHFVAADFHPEMSLIGVFDGHAGEQCAKLCAKLLPIQLTQQMLQHTDKDKKGPLDATTLPAFLDGAFPECFLELDRKLKLNKIPDDSGCTAVAVAVTKTHVICASVGDSRAVLCANGAAIELARDHKCELPGERARIEAAGGHVENNRVNGELAMSRALGDFRYKGASNLPPDAQLVIAKPGIISAPRPAATDATAFVALACDGVFDVLTNDQLVAMIRECLEVKKMSLSEAAEFVVSKCVVGEAPGGSGPAAAAGTDNVSLIICKLN